LPPPPPPPDSASFPKASNGPLVLPLLLQVWSDPLMTHCADALDGHKAATQSPAAKHAPHRSSMM
jgi:hypothetical protein